MKLIVTGYARHGKDTVCDLLCQRLGLKFVSSSYFVAEKAVRPALEKLEIKYATLDACYADRVNHREEWFKAISEYNTPDPARLGVELFKEYDIYCGLRSLREFISLCRTGIVDATVWVDASTRMGTQELRTSITITPNVCDYTIDNNGSLEDLKLQVEWLIFALQLQLLSHDMITLSKIL